MRTFPQVPTVPTVQWLLITWEIIFRYLCQPCQSQNPTSVPTKVLNFTRIQITANGNFLFYQSILSPISHPRYLECFNGVLTSVECPFCDWWDVEKEQCNQVRNGMFISHIFPGRALLHSFIVNDNLFIQPPTVDCGDRLEPPPVETCDSCESGFEGKCPCPWGYFADPYDCDQYHYCQGTADPLEYGCSNATFDGLYNADMIQVCTSINNLTFKR